MFVPVPTPEEMALWDAGAISAGISEETLMESAARAAMDCLREHVRARGLSLSGARVLLVAGAGNNGGDAFCMARHLLDAGACPVLACTRSFEKYRGAAAHWLDVAVKLGVPVVSAEAWERGETDAPATPDIVVDGLLGTGFRGALREKEARLVERMNALSPRLLLAIDVPSGLDARTGLPSPIAVRAHATVTLQAAKPGLLLPRAAAYTGLLCVRPIGMPRAVQTANPPSFRTWLLPGQREDAGAGCDIPHGVSPLLSDLLRHKPLPGTEGPAHKGDAGRVLVAGGCAAYTGAPTLSARAALRAGAGLVTVAGPRPVLETARLILPALTMLSLSEENDGSWKAEHGRRLAQAVPGYGALVFGPGLGRNDGAADALEEILSAKKRPPMVLDADALFALTRRPGLLSLLRPCDVLTPHPGEAATLLGVAACDVQADRFSALKGLASLAGAVWVLKGEGTLVSIPGEPAVISPWQVPQLAVAGSGDVLAGLVGALLARGCGASLAATLGVWLHALAGVHLADAFPLRGNGPDDIADALPFVMHLAGWPCKEDSCSFF